MKKIYMKPAIELLKLENECMCEESLGLKEGASNDYDRLIKENLDTDPESVLGLQDMLKLW